MTDTNAAQANNTDVPALLNHIADMQTLALKAEELMEVVCHLENEGVCAAGRHVLSEEVFEKLKRLNLGLDSVNLRGVAS